MYRTQQRLQRVLARKGVQGLSSPCFKYFNNNRQHFFGGLIVLCMFALVIPSTIIGTSKKFAEEVLPPNGELKEYKEFHDMLESGQGDLAQETSTPYGTCTVQCPLHPTYKMNPILVATFPGSSSDLMRLLIETITGLWTGARTFRDDVVAIKTHYPYYENHINADNKGYTPRALLVMRSPMETLRVFHAYIQMTSTQRGAETEDWERWRDANFNEQLKHWDDFMRYWLSSEDLGPTRRHVVIHEKLIDEITGPEEVTEMVQFMVRVAKLTNDIPFEDIPCLWSRVVHFQLQPEPSRRRLRQVTSGASEEIREELSYPYTYVQLDKIAGILTQMIEDFVLDDKVLHALINYRMTALESMQRLLGDDPVLVSNVRGTCMVTTPQYEPMIPMFQASYPGSGSAMMRDLIEGITGVKTAETKRRDDVVAIKTLYPVRSFDLHPNIWNRNMKKMILLVRFPLHAISSNFDHIYWRQNNLQAHSAQPPKEIWEAWRDEHFKNELNAWVDHLQYWMGNFKAANRLIVTYETLTHKEQGPQDTLRLALFIRTAFNEGTINPAPAFTLPCLWFRAVRVFNQSNVNMFQDNNHAAGNNYQPIFTTLQLEMAATKLNTLQLKFSTDRRLGPILQKYWEHTVNQIH